MKMQTKTAQEGHFIGTSNCSICIHYFEKGALLSVYDFLKKKKSVYNTMQGLFSTFIMSKVSVLGFCTLLKTDSEINGYKLN